MRNALLLSLFLVACGDNIVPPGQDGPGDHGPTDDLPVDPGTGECVAIDWNQTCPDASLPPPDASTEQCDAPGEPPPLDDETKAACCHALLDGTPPNHECGYPPGLCKNGRKTMFCKNDLGEDAQFELCNP